MLRNPRVLIIEDDACAGYYMARSFHKYRYVTETHTTREDAAVKLNEFQPDLIVMDFVMPGISAEAFMETCKAVCPQAKTIFLGEPGQPQTITRFKADAFFNRPFIAEGLVEYANKLTRYAEQ